ncbi:MAG: MFS transporter [Caldisericaceae bacterium]
MKKTRANIINVVILGLTSFFTDVSTEMIVKVLPLFLESIGAGGAFIGVIEGLAETTSSILKIFSGYISDKIRNRKWLTIFGYAESTVSKFFLLFSKTPFSVLIVRFFERIGKGIRTSPRDALIASYTDETNRGFYFGFHRALDTFGAAVAPLLAFWVLDKFGKTNYEAVFKIALIPAVIAVLILFFVKEKKLEKEIKKSQGTFFKNLNLGKKFYIFLFAITIFTLGNSSDAFITMYASSFGIFSTTILLMWFVNTIVYAILSTPFGILSDKIGRKATLILGLTIYGISYLAFALAKSETSFWWIFAIYGVYYALSEGSQRAYISDFVAKDEVRGTAYGLYNFAVGIMSFPASLIAGILYQYVAPSAPFFFGGFLAIFSAILIFFI